MAGLAGYRGEVCVECIRVLGVDGHGIVRRVPELAGFLQLLDDMIIQGRVFDDTPDASAFGRPPNEGGHTTLARIALEEVQDEYTAIYGNHTRKLWGNAGGVAFGQAGRASRGPFCAAVGYLKDRIAVVIGRADHQAAFAAFGLGAWSRVIAGAQGTPVDASMIE